MNIIQVYATSCGFDSDKIEQFYIDIDMVLIMTKPHDITLIQRDLTAKFVLE